MLFTSSVSTLNTEQTHFMSIIILQVCLLLLNGTLSLHFTPASTRPDQNTKPYDDDGQKMKQKIEMGWIVK